jgi:hypothetical protein
MYTWYITYSDEYGIERNTELYAVEQNIAEDEFYERYPDCEIISIY